MKKQFLSVLVCLITLGSTEISANVQEALTLQYGKIDGSSTHHGAPKSPALPWCIDFTDNVITMSATPCDYTLTLYDEDGDVAYSVFVPAGTTQVILPSTLSGDFELRFETGTYYYYGYINF